MAPSLPPSGEPERLGRVETNVEHIMEIVREIKLDMRDLRRDIDEQFKEQRETLEEHAKAIAESNGRRQTILLIWGATITLGCSIMAAIIGALAHRIWG